MFFRVAPLSSSLLKRGAGSLGGSRWESSRLKPLPQVQRDPAFASFVVIPAEAGQARSAQNGRRPPEGRAKRVIQWFRRSEEHTSELQSLMRISYAVFCLKKKKKQYKKS